MEIDKNVANEIVKKLSETISQNLNFMDTNGIIIASSDKKRVGQIHGGAVKLLNENLPELIVESDNQFKGAKSGINLPIVFEDETVGTIGITGNVSEVLKYGQIIKHMTEILLLDNKIKEQRIIDEKARDRFYEEWLIESLEESNPAEFSRLARDLSINTEKSYRIIALTVTGEKKPGSDTLSDISGYIRNSIKKELDGNAFRTATHMYCIIDEEKSAAILPVIESIKKEIRGNFSCDIKAGASNEGAVLHLASSCKKATLAMERGMISDSNEVITFYDDFDINYLIKGLTDENRAQYLRHLFHNASPEEINASLAFSKVYLEENGSIVSIGKRLFIHPNTVKYRISKLTALTGIDIRTCHGAYVFTLATLL